MKKNLLITAIVLALSGGAFAQTVLPLLPASHGMTGNQPAYSAQQQQEFPAMATGWNWWSSYIDLSDDGLGMLEETLGNNASMIKSQGIDGFVSYSGGLWVGSLASLSNDKMYAIMMSTTPQNGLEMRGSALTIADVEITAHPGWTWVGFPSNSIISVANAMANYTPSNGDMVKGKTAFATYYNGNWTGELDNMIPGYGYKIYRSSTSTAQFHYASQRESVEFNEYPTLNYLASTSDFADNMSMIATINLFGKELNSSNYEVAAFVGNDCRGAIIPRYIESLDRYFAFLTISGEGSENLQFCLLDKESGEVYLADNRYNYSNDAIEGSIDKPYVLDFNTLMSNDELFVGKMDMFPNPVRRNGMVTISIPSVSKNMKVQVINSLGMVVRNENINSEKTNISVNLAPGVYIVKIVANDKQFYVEKLIVE